MVRFLFFLFLVPIMAKAQSIPVNYLSTAEELLTAIKNKENIASYIKTLEVAESDQLASQLGTDEQKTAFWLNVYNAYIQIILSKNPEKYKDRRNFFKNKQIVIAGENLSFADIEHGIIRGSQHEFFLGYLKNPFADKFEKKFRVGKRNYRIHFALNCGAKSCPPVAVYDWTRLSEQLEQGTEAYLNKYTTYVDKENTAYVSSLFSWFRGDFGGLDGIKNILQKKQLIPDKNTRLKTTTYDWSLDLGNYIEL